MRRRIVGLALAGALAGAGALAAESPELDACRLLRPAEIESVQGAAVTHSKASQRASGGLRFAQCYYVVAAEHRSVSLEVTLPDPSHDRPASPARQWREAFHRPNEKDEKKGEEEEKDAEPPRPVAGLGDEAFWLGDRIMGALYVLLGDRFLRISLGGSEDAAIKIEKGKQLAAKALGRL